ncbi:MAG: phosphoribosylglycinamide formyltransferase [Actinobacteria bacterium HGW-Actinobacteria-7]|jgi:phosphoribosylglycinamide formyltransferase-1|nr:MAG: phosphoribosylglycinamide formyltransferase [Actinobacteria bacterium HGW-Actinobacteria-7]
MSERGPLRLGVLISGSGSNLQAIIDAIEGGTLDAVVAVVISSRSDAFGLERARNHGIEAVWVDREMFDDAAGYNAALRDELQAHSVDYVVMAGYMRLLGKAVLDAYPLRVLNLHPALLPSFPGAHGIADAFAYGVKVTGITVHFADEVFDRGPIIAQRAVEIAETDTIESLEAKIHDAEHQLYPAVIQLIAQERVKVDGRVVCIAQS